ncbi:hypothetical protein MHM83_10910 [Tenacibaculum sp. Mcav3-52]|uniref:hypothetical protein n=1 Tax=Tenacibaculum sp. Mcav3-52 TaxID=2917762 RepID=UPI001EF24B6C|nr:hypothetical protein [Tenacibaculum sp. Mcav3-52]MCG7502382.1 hypothetical protein [Tenacibaculum sp. Mcav3-52]
MESLACGEVGLEIMYFYSLTPRQFYNVLKGFRKREAEKEQSEWYRARMLMYHAILPYSDNKKLKIQDIMEFPWEETQETEKSRKPKSREELKQIFDKK